MTLRLLLLTILVALAFSDCAFVVDDDLKPHKAEGDELEPSPITWTISCS